MTELPIELFLAYALLAVACERCGAPVEDGETVCAECGDDVGDDDAVLGVAPRSPVSRDR